LLKFAAGPDVAAERRKRLLRQSYFWSVIGLCQSAGSRMERRSRLPIHVRLLLTIVYADLADAQALVSVMRGGDEWMKVQRNKKPPILFTAREDVVQLRRELDLAQGPFWAMVEVIQTVGSRYENCDLAIPPVVATLLTFVFGPDLVARALFDDLRERGRHDAEEDQLRRMPPTPDTWVSP
jgi:hypothetical protein